MLAALPLALGDKVEGAPEDEELVEKDLLPTMEEEEVVRQEGDPKVLEEWMRLEVEVQEIEIQNYTMVETLSSRQGVEVKACLARMVARKKYLGLEVRRVHSDGAAEMLGTRRWCEDRGIYRTFTSGSGAKSHQHSHQGLW